MKIKTILLFFCALPFVVSSQQNDTPKTAIGEKGMIKVTILYPNEEGKTFDMAYYSSKHMPLVATLFGDALKGYEIDEGMSGRTAEEPLPFVAIGYLYFKSLDDYNNAFGQNGVQILNDIPNYTNIQPVIQISKVIQ